jgi:hypothetical protein
MTRLTFVCAVLLSVPALAADNDFKATFIKHWQTAKEFTLAVAEAMPAEGFKPNPEELSFGRLMVHIADDNSTMCARVARTKPLPPPSAGNKLIVIQFMTQSFDKCAQEIRALTPEQWSGRRTGTKGSRYSHKRHCCTPSRTWLITAVKPRSTCA